MTLLRHDRLLAADFRSLASLHGTVDDRFIAAVLSTGGGYFVFDLSLARSMTLSLDCFLVSMAGIILTGVDHQTFIGTSSLSSNLALVVMAGCIGIVSLVGFAALSITQVIDTVIGGVTLLLAGGSGYRFFIFMMGCGNNNALAAEFFLTGFHRAVDNAVIAAILQTGGRNFIFLHRFRRSMSDFCDGLGFAGAEFFVTFSNRTVDNLNIAAFFVAGSYLGDLLDCRSGGMRNLFDHLGGCAHLVSLADGTIHNLVIAAFAVAGCGLHVLLHRLAGNMTLSLNSDRVALQLLAAVGAGTVDNFIIAAILGTGNSLFVFYLLFTQIVAKCIYLFTGQHRSAAFAGTGPVAFGFTGGRHRRTLARFMAQHLYQHSRADGTNLVGGTGSLFAFGMRRLCSALGFAAEFFLDVLLSTDRAIHNLFVAAFLGTGSFGHILLHRGAGSMIDLLNRLFLAAQHSLAAFHSTVDNLFVAAFCIAGSGLHVLLHSHAGGMTLGSNFLGIAMQFAGRLGVLTGKGFYARLGTGGRGGYFAGVVMTQRIHMSNLQLLTALNVTPDILAGLGGIAIRFTSGRRYFALIVIMAGCRQFLLRTVEFLTAHSTLDNLIVAALYLTGSGLFVITNRLALRMVGSGNGDGFTADFRLTLRNRAVHNALIAAIIFTGSGYFLFTYGFSRSMVDRFDGLFFASQFSLTLRNRAVHDFFVAAFCIAGSGYFLFMYSFGGSMSELFNGLCFAAQFSVAAFHRAVHDFFIAAFCIAGSGYFALAHSLAGSMAIFLNHLLLKQHSVAQGTLFALFQTGFGTGGSLVGQHFAVLGGVIQRSNFLGVGMGSAILAIGTAIVGTGVGHLANGGTGRIDGLFALVAMLGSRNFFLLGPNIIAAGTSQALGQAGLFTIRRDGGKDFFLVVAQRRDVFGIGMLFTGTFGVLTGKGLYALIHTGRGDGFHAVVIVMIQLGIHYGLTATLMLSANGAVHNLIVFAVGFTGSSVHVFNGHFGCGGMIGQRQINLGAADFMVAVFGGAVNHAVVGTGNGTGGFYAAFLLRLGGGMLGQSQLVGLTAEFFAAVVTVHNHVVGTGGGTGGFYASFLHRIQLVMAGLGDGFGCGFRTLVAFPGLEAIGGTGFVFHLGGSHLGIAFPRVTQLCNFRLRGQDFLTQAALHAGGQAGFGTGSVLGGQGYMVGFGVLESGDGFGLGCVALVTSPGIQTVVVTISVNRFGGSHLGIAFPRVTQLGNNHGFHNAVAIYDLKIVILGQFAAVGAVHNHVVAAVGGTGGIDNAFRILHSSSGGMAGGLSNGIGIGIAALLIAPFIGTMVGGIAHILTGGGSYSMLIVMAGSIKGDGIGVIATATGIGTHAVYQTGSSLSYFILIIVVQSCYQHRVTHRTNLSGGTGSRCALGMGQHFHFLNVHMTAHAAGSLRFALGGTGSGLGYYGFAVGMRHHNGFGIGAVFSTFGTAIDTGEGFDTGNRTGGFLGDLAFIVGMAGSGNFFLRNQHFVTHGAVLAFGQAFLKTGSGVTSINHFGVTKGSYFLNASHRITADGTLGTSGITNGGTSGCDCLNGIFGMTAGSGDCLGIFIMTVGTGIGHNTSVKAGGRSGFFANIGIAQPHAKFGIISISCLAGMLGRFNIIAIGVLQLSRGNFNRCIDGVAGGIASLNILVSYCFCTSGHFDFTSTRTAQAGTGRGSICAFTDVNGTVNHNLSVTKVSITGTAGSVLDGDNLLVVCSNVPAPFSLIINVGITVHVTGGAFINDNFSIRQHCDILINIQRTAAVHINSKVGRNR